MIDKQFGDYVLVCDFCEEEADECWETFQDAVDGKKARGWKSQKTSRLGDLSQGGRGCIYETAQGDGTYLSSAGRKGL